jgi:hypothetical protein
MPKLVSCPTESLVFELLGHVQINAPSSFSGLGLVFYRAPLRLPVASLGDQSLFLPTLPVHGVDAIARVLADISGSASLWHDGFHLVELSAVALTHVSQFFAPPIHLVTPLHSGATPIGARQMAATVGSKIPSVEYTAILSKSEGPLVFRAGTAVSRPSCSR